MVTLAGQAVLEESVGIVSPALEDAASQFETALNSTATALVVAGRDEALLGGPPSRMETTVAVQEVVEPPNEFASSLTLTASASSARATDDIRSPFPSSDTARTTPASSSRSKNEVESARSSNQQSLVARAERRAQNSSISPSVSSREKESLGSNSSPQRTRATQRPKTAPQSPEKPPRPLETTTANVLIKASRPPKNSISRSNQNAIASTSSLTSPRRRSDELAPTETRTTVSDGRLSRAGLRIEVDKSSSTKASAKEAEGSTVSYADFCISSITHAARSQCSRTRCVERVASSANLAPQPRSVCRLELFDLILTDFFRPRTESSRYQGLLSMANSLH